MSNRRTTKPKHRRPSAAARHGQRAVVVTVTGGMAAGGFIAGAGSAMADHTTVSQAQGYFLSGNVAGVSLSDILPIASAVNKSHDASSAPVVDSQLGTNLGDYSLPAAPLPGLGGVDLLDDILNVGALNEYARANADGSSFGSSGAVTNSGAFDGTTPNSNASVNLNPLLGGVLGTVADLKVQIGPLAASATESKTGTQTGDYKIADLKIDLQSPALATVLGTLNSALTTANGLINSTDLLAAVPLGLADALTGTMPDLADPLSNFNSSLLTDSDAISIDPSDGSISINVSNLVNLNNLPANTDILPYILGALDGVLGDALDNLTADVTTELTRTLGANLLGVPLAGLPLAAALDPVNALLASTLVTVTGAIDTATTGQASLLDAGSGGLIGDILDGVLDLVANVQQTAGGIFTERALSVGLSLPAGLGGITSNAVAAGDLALINLASAAVGPNAGAVVAALAPPKITDPDDGEQMTDRTPLIEGTGVAGAKVTVKEGSDTICTATVASNGKWKCTSGKLALGKHTIVATQKLGDRTSAKSNVVDFTIVAPDYNDDTVLPATGGNGSTAPLAAAGLGLLLGGMGLTAAPRLARHGGRASGGSGSRAGGGRHAKR